LPAGFTARPDVVAQLEKAGPDQVVAVIAPAGHGKTLLLAEWVRDEQGPPTAWVSLDRDDDPPRLWSAVLTALAALPGVPADSALPRLGHAGTDPVGGDLVDDLAEAIDELDAPVRLVLDDVHDLPDPGPLRDIGRLIRRRPRNLQLVLASRSDPPLGLPRLRLEGRLVELRADRLRFSLADTMGLLRSAGLDLPPQDVARLYQRTEGWVAGVRLAAIALRRTDDPPRFIAEFSGDERSVADYLTGEVLSGLPADAQEFLAAVSGCSRLPAALAAALTGRQDAGRTLDDLGRETSLVERTEAGMYRIHELLRSYLAASVRRHRPALYRQQHSTAAVFWADAGQPAHALRHAERAGDEAMLASFLQRTGIAMLLSGEAEPVRRGLAAVGPARRSADPWLALTSALTHIEGRAYAAAAAEMQQARRAWANCQQPGLEMLRASAELLGSGLGFADVGADAPDVAALPLGEAPELDALLSLSRGAAGLTPNGRGDHEVAHRELERAVAIARAHDFGYLEVVGLSLIATLAGVRRDHAGMVAAAEDAVAAAARAGRHPSSWTAGPASMLAYADLLAGMPARARQRAAEVLDAVNELPPEAKVVLHAVHGAARADEGDRSSGLAEMQAARRDTDLGHAPQSLVAAVAVLEHRVALLTGNPGAADEVRTWLQRRTGRVVEIDLLESWGLLAAERHDAARSAVEPHDMGARPVLLAHTPIEVLLVRAEAALATGDAAASSTALDEALRLGAAVGILRPFALAGPHTRTLLRRQLSATGPASFTTRLGAALAAVSAEGAALLSAREMAVLALLPSLLSAAEIAGELSVSVNTVKSHIRSVYTKLGATSRREAVLRASERGLLP
jgi:LuxR family maltose regulon positive regulatory protein